MAVQEKKDGNKMKSETQMAQHGQVLTSVDTPFFLVFKVMLFSHKLREVGTTHLQFKTSQETGDQQNDADNRTLVSVALLQVYLLSSCIIKIYTNSPDFLQMY